MSDKSPAELEDEAYAALLDAALGREKCDYRTERWLVYMQISTLVGGVCADVCSIYGTRRPSGMFDHHAAELRKVLGWYADVLIEHAHSWAGRPLPNPREPVASARWHPCEEP